MQPRTVLAVLLVVGCNHRPTGATDGAPGTAGAEAGMRTSAPDPQAVVVSRASLASAEPYDVIFSNLEFVVALMEEYIAQDEIAADAMRSYYVDYYLAEVNNGGFSQFVYNSKWDPAVVRRVREGLSAMGAKRHLELFERNAEVLDGLGAAGLARYLDSGYSGDNADRDVLGAHDDAFYALDKEESLVALNAAWLRSRPGLRALTDAEMEAEIARRAAAVPDRERRIAEARAKEPRYLKTIRALCELAGHELDGVTAGDPSHVHGGKMTLAWYFRTDRGLFYMIEVDGRAIMFNGETNTRVADVAALPPEESDD